MNRGALRGAATRICPHQTRQWAHQIEAKVPGPPGRWAEQVIRLTRWAAWAHRATSPV